MFIDIVNSLLYKLKLVPIVFALGYQPSAIHTKEIAENVTCVVSSRIVNDIYRAKVNNVASDAVVAVLGAERSDRAQIIVYNANLHAVDLIYNRDAPPDEAGVLYVSFCLQLFNKSVRLNESQTTVQTAS